MEYRRSEGAFDESSKGVQKNKTTDFNNSQILSTHIHGLSMNCEKVDGYSEEPKNEWILLQFASALAIWSDEAYFSDVLTRSDIMNKLKEQAVAPLTREYKAVGS